MRLFLDILYIFVLVCASPWLVYGALRYGKYREGLGAKLLGRIDLPANMATNRRLWFHAVSVGEVLVLEPVVERARSRWPDHQMIISTTSRTGFELAKKRFTRDVVTYAPLDFSWAVARAVRCVRPELLVFVELELWPNWIRAAAQHGAKLAIINGRLSGKSASGYRWIRPWIRSALRRFSFIGAQNEVYAERFSKLGAQADVVSVTGSIKFDNAQSDRDNPRSRQLSAWAHVGSRQTLFLAGSTQAPEERFALDTYLQLKPRFPNLRLALVPRHPERFDAVAEILEDAGHDWVRRSQWQSVCPTADEIILVDTIGELADWWGTAQIGFVGGSFGSRGGQNMIEPAAMGVATSFGPNTTNFRDVTEALVQAEACVVVRSAEELTRFVERCLTSPEYAQTLGFRASEVVTRQRGALSRTIAGLGKLTEAVATVERRPFRSRARRRSKMT